MKSPSFVAGVRIADRYELVEQIGAGGMGSVWRAQHIALDAPVAIKFVRTQGDDPERFHARFQREAKLAASVRHRSVVSIIDYGHLEDGTAYMVMDHLEGEPLSDYLQTKPAARELVYIVELVTRGLVAVHEAGIVHRDLKPENIFLVRDATGVYPKLIDFGISKHMRPEGERRSAVTTTDGAIVGTPAYMSPEQARGLLEIDQRTDIYSMGVILYEGLSGRLPYDSPYIGDLILAIVMGGATPLHELRPDLDRRLCDVVMKAMAQDATQRYASARELLAALSEVAPPSVDLLRSDRPPGSPRTSAQSISTVIRASSDTAMPRGVGPSPFSSSVSSLELDLSAPSDPAELARPLWWRRRVLLATAIGSAIVLLALGMWIGAPSHSPQGVEQVAAAASPAPTGAEGATGAPAAMPEPRLVADASAPRNDAGSATATTADEAPVTRAEPPPVEPKPRAASRPARPARAAIAPKPSGDKSARPKRVITELDY